MTVSLVLKTHRCTTLKSTLIKDAEATNVLTDGH